MYKNRKIKTDIFSLILVAVIFIYILGPIAVMVLHSIATEWFVIEQWWGPSKIGLDWFAFIARDPDLIKASWLTISLASTVAVFTTALLILPAYAIGTGKIRFGKDLFEIFGSIPQAVPAIVLGIGLLPVYAHLGWLYTFHGVVLAHSVGAVPYVFRHLVSGFRMINPELEEAARSLGAGRLKIIYSIYLPILKPFLAAAGALAFTWSINEFILTQLLGFPTITTLAVRVYQTAGGYYWAPHKAGALSTILIAVSFSVVFIVEKLTKIKLAGPTV